MTTGPIPDETPSNLEEQLLLEEAKRGEGKLIFYGLRKPLRYAPNLWLTMAVLPKIGIK